MDFKPIGSIKDELDLSGIKKEMAEVEKEDQPAGGEETAAAAGTPPPPPSHGQSDGQGGSAGETLTSQASPPGHRPVRGETRKGTNKAVVAVVIILLAVVLIVITMRVLQAEQHQDSAAENPAASGVYEESGAGPRGLTQAEHKELMRALQPRIQQADEGQHAQQQRRVQEAQALRDHLNNDSTRPQRSAL